MAESLSRQKMTDDRRCRSFQRVISVIVTAQSLSGIWTNAMTEQRISRTSSRNIGIVPQTSFVSPERRRYRQHLGRNEAKPRRLRIKDNFHALYNAAVEGSNQDQDDWKLFDITSTSPSHDLSDEISHQHSEESLSFDFFDGQAFDVTSMSLSTSYEDDMEQLPEFIPMSMSSSMPIFSLDMISIPTLNEDPNYEEWAFDEVKADLQLSYPLGFTSNGQGNSGFSSLSSAVPSNSPTIHSQNHRLVEEENFDWALEHGAFSLHLFSLSFSFSMSMPISNDDNSVSDETEREMGVAVSDDSPSFSPVKAASEEPSSAPMDPTSEPTFQPTYEPTDFPTYSPTWSPVKKPTEFPTFYPTLFPTKKPTVSPSKTPTEFPTVPPTGAPTMEPTWLPSTKPTDWPTFYPTLSPNKSPSASPSNDPTETPTESPTKVPSSEPTDEPTKFPSSPPTSSPTKVPTDSPTLTPSAKPTLSPSTNPSASPTRGPTGSPTDSPSEKPTDWPTFYPTWSPTTKPTKSPTSEPTFPQTKAVTAPPTEILTFASVVVTPNPTKLPTSNPTRKPTVPPTSEPTVSPSKKPTRKPTSPPSAAPTLSPSADPTNTPSVMKSNGPSVQPSSSHPTASPTKNPSRMPTYKPSDDPSMMPSIAPSEKPTETPTEAPTTAPTKNPTKKPTRMPTRKPTNSPSLSPTDYPTTSPSDAPSLTPSKNPTRGPTTSPTKSPSESPTEYPTGSPTDSPSTHPTLSPSRSPTRPPTKKPTMSPTVSPSFSPTGSPTTTPSGMPSLTPSIKPTKGPTTSPTVSPTSSPTESPSAEPTSLPSIEPTLNPSESPSSSPSRELMSFSTDTSILLEDISSPMDNETSSEFEEVTTQFMIDTLSHNESETEVIVTSVKIINQILIDLNGTSSRRLGGRKLKSVLKVDLAVEGEMERNPPESFSIEEEVQSGINENFDDFTQSLADNSDFFASYDKRESFLPSPVQSQDGNDSNSLDNKWIMIIIGGCVALAVLVGSIYVMERRSGVTVERTREVSDEGGDGYDLADIAPEEKDKKIQAPPPVDTEEKSANQIVSPRTKSLVDNDDEESEKSTSTNGEEDDDMGLNLSPGALKAAVKRESNIFIFTHNDVEGGRSSMSPGQNSMLNIKHSVSSLSNPSNIDELPSPSPRFLTGEAFDYRRAEKMLGDQYDTRAILTPVTPRGGGSRGGGSMTPSRKSYSFSSPVNANSSRKDKIFDCYAPPGPLGIIIDTTPEGPMIHSLKPTSQLLGLVNPGDLIVGLDGVDTRNMTAATFTRLMAKRSQGERKITLLKGLAPLTPTTPVS